MGVLGVLGVAVGASTIDPTGDSPSATELGVGAGIWYLISGILALFAGGFATGRLSNLRRKGETTLHGLVVWGIYSVLAVMLTTTMLGSMVLGAGRALAHNPQLRHGAKQALESADPARAFTDEGEVNAPPHSFKDKDRVDREAVRDERAQQTVDAISAASWWSFAYLVLTAIAAAVGCMIAAPREDKRFRGNTTVTTDPGVAPPPIV
jgi:hypothetical protein